MCAAGPACVRLGRRRRPLRCTASGDVLLKDFFAQTQNTQRIVQLPQQQVSSSLELPGDVRTQLTTAVANAKLPPLKQSQGHKRERASTVPNPNAKYPIDHNQVCVPCEARA